MVVVGIIYGEEVNQIHLEVYHYLGLRRCVTATTVAVTAS